MIEENENGGKASRIKGKFTEIPPRALIEISDVCRTGVKAYPRDESNVPNWHKLSCPELLDHSLNHAFQFIHEANYADSDVEKMREELSHFATRAMMALEIFLKELEDNGSP